MPTVMDTFANSHAEAVKRVEKIALGELPDNASQEDKDACKIDLVQADMRDRSAFKDIFAKYKGDDAIKAVILVAALKAVGESGEIPIECVSLFSPLYQNRMLTLNSQILQCKRHWSYQPTCRDEGCQLHSTGIQ